MADPNMQRIEPEHNQGAGNEQEKGPEPAKRRRGRPRGSGRGKGRAREAGGNNGDEGGEGGGRTGRTERTGPGKIDYALRETEDGSDEWKAKCYSAHRETDHVFVNKTAAAVSFDISHIIAIQRGFCRPEGRTGGCYLENASRHLLEDLMDVRPVKNSHKNGKDDLHSAVLVIGRMLDDFLSRIRSIEDADREGFVYRPNPQDNHIIQLCFSVEKLSNPRHMSDVPGLKEIVEKHLEAQPLPNNPSSAIQSVARMYTDDERSPGNLERPAQNIPEEVTRVRSKRKAAEDNTAGVSGSKKQRKRKDIDVAGEGGDGEDCGAENPTSPALILEVVTECPNHGHRTSTHYHFAHDCICEAKIQMQNCFNFLNLEPRYRIFLRDDQLPPCFQEWKNSLFQVPPNF